MKNKETLEEVELTKFALSEAKKWVSEDDHHKIATYATAISVGAKWQQERSYSEEDMKLAFVTGALTDLFNTWNISNEDMAKEKFVNWFEQVKKK